MSFYWAERPPDESVPEGMTVAVSPYHAAMAGTERHPPRCVALLGDLGEAVRCTVYDLRPSPCREFGASWEDGTPNPRCDDARRRIGLEPLTPDTWKRRLPAA